MKNIKDIIHLYLGAKVQHINAGGIFLLKSVSLNAYRIGGIDDDVHFNVPLDNFKPILRPLSDMTETEAKELLKIRYNQPHQEPIYERHSSLCIDFKFPSADYGKFNHTQLDWDCLDGKSVAYLLSKGFDLFGLIESSQAIDGTKQPA